MKQNEQKIVVDKSGRLEIDVSSLPFGNGLTRIDWGWDELQTVGEETRNGYLVFTESRLESALRSYLALKFDAPVGNFKWTWDKYNPITVKVKRK